MNLQYLNPWNWFKHEESGMPGQVQVPVRKSSKESDLPSVYERSSHPLGQLHQELDRLVDNVFRGIGLPSSGSSVFNSPLFDSSNWATNTGFRPNLNVSSNDECYEITLEVPGLSESDMSVEVRGDVLTIQGQKQEQKEDKDSYFYRVERSYGTFQRTLALPDDADPDRIQAAMKDGVLSLTIPRSAVQDTQVKKITIN